MAQKRKMLTLKAEMIKQGISALQLSHDLGINSTQFSMYVNGWRDMPSSLKKEIAEYLKVSYEELFQGVLL